MTGNPIQGLEKLWRRLGMVVGLGRIRIGNDGGGVQMQQIEFPGGDLRDNTPRVAEYGFASMPKAGCQAVVIFASGDRSNGVVIGTNDEASRLKGLLPGEVAIYDDQGQSVYIKRGGIVIDGGGLPITILNAPTITADTPLLKVTGDVQDNCNTNPVTMAQMRATYDVHTHNENNALHGPTDVPNQEMV